jgi:signal transduction histidine kinase
VWFDRLLALVLLVAAELEIFLTHDAQGHRLLEALLAPAMAACVAFRRDRPALAGITAQLLMAVTFGVWGGSQVIGVSIAWFCALYGLTVWSSRRGFVTGVALVVASDLLAALGEKGTLAASVPFAVVTAVVMVLVRRIVGDRERRAELAERERDLVAREAVVEERARIARELHDAIAHSVSMMVVQAGAERRVLEDDRGETRDVLATIEEIGREALTEMRRLVGMLRSDVDEPLAPQPGLADLPGLVGQVRDAGLPVALTIEGEPRALPVGLELSAYRIVQEALTNALKHAGNASAAVRVHYRADAIELEIVDDGVSPVAASGGGHGLVGMRERVALYGGRFDAGRRSGGGFGVRVLLPIR